MAERTHAPKVALRVHPQQPPKSTERHTHLVAQAQVADLQAKLKTSEATIESLQARLIKGAMDKFEQAETPAGNAVEVGVP